jgi:hypothetical protein
MWPPANGPAASSCGRTSTAGLERQSWSKLFTRSMPRGTCCTAWSARTCPAALSPWSPGDQHSVSGGAGVPAPEGGWSLPGAGRLLIQPAQDGQLGIAPVMRGLGESAAGAAAIVLTLLCLSYGRRSGPAAAHRGHNRGWRRCGARDCLCWRRFWSAMRCYFSPRFEPCCRRGGGGRAPGGAVSEPYGADGLSGHAASGVERPGAALCALVLLVLCPILFDASGCSRRWGRCTCPSRRAHYLHGAIAPLLALTASTVSCAWLACRFSK